MTYRSESTYRWLLRLLPRRFANRYGDEMLEVHRNDADNGDLRWSCIVLDVITTAAREHVRERQRAMRDRRSASWNATANTHQPHGDGMLMTLAQDIRYALRNMRRRPAFSIIVLATLTLGIGANTAIFSVVNGVLFRALPYPDADRIVQLAHEQPVSSVSEPEFMDYRRDMRAFEKLAGFSDGEVSLTSGDQPLRVVSARVSSDFFSILGVRPELGRVFVPDEFTPAGARVVLISDGLWRSQFGGDSSILGRDIIINGQNRTVVGVMPAGFDYPSADNAIWSAWRLNPDSLWTRNNHYLTLIGRLAPGRTVESARVEANALGLRWLADFPETYAKGKPLVARVQTISAAITGTTRPFLLVLLGAVGFVLLIACVNVANLFLTRGESRRKEVAIRSALGATHGRLIAQMLTEGMLYAVLGGILGVLAAVVGVRLLILTSPASLPRVDAIRIDGSVLLFNFMVALVTGLAFGLVPALRNARGQAIGTLRESNKGLSNRGSSQLRKVLVISEVALAVVMLAGAGLMLRSLWKLQGTELGFDPSHVLTAQVSLPAASYPPERRAAFFDQVVSRVASTPGVTSAAAVRQLPIREGGDRYSIMVDNVVLQNISDSPSPSPQQVTPDFFATMRIPLVSGRMFTGQDRLDAPMVAIVNEQLARELWKGVNPIGHTIKMFDSTAPWATIVGVVKDTRAEGLVEPVPPTMYFPYAQAERSNYSAATTMSIVVRTPGAPSTAAGAVRDAVHALDPALPVSRVSSMDDVVASSIDGRRFSTVLLALFAVVALTLAGIGIYGVIAFSVSQRTYEIGVRVALGAQRSSVMSLIVRQVMTMAGAGVAVGVLAAAMIAQAARSMFVGVTAFDPATFGAATLLIAAVAAIACAVPIRRALGVNPTEALRGE